MTNDTKYALEASLKKFLLKKPIDILDGEQRVDVLNSVLAKILDDGNANVADKETEIENHKKEIARLEKEISEQQSEMKVSENSINTEVGRISGLIKFIEGGDN